MPKHIFVFSLCLCLNSEFIKDLFPENLDAEKRGRPTTAGTKIKVFHNTWLIQECVFHKGYLLSYTHNCLREELYYLPQLFFFYVWS